MLKMVKNHQHDNLKQASVKNASIIQNSFAKYKIYLSVAKIYEVKINITTPPKK